MLIDFRFFIQCFFFIERPVRINIRYLSVGISESAVSDIFYSLFAGRHICAFPMLTEDEIQSCLKTSHVFNKDGMHGFNKMFGVALKYVNRNIKKSAADQMKGKLHEVLEGTNLHYFWFAQSKHLEQAISISSSEKLCDPSCIVKISSAHVKYAETSLRAAEAELNVDPAKIITLKDCVASSKSKEFRNMIRSCIEKVESAPEPDLSCIVGIMNCIPMEFSQVPNGSTVRPERPLKSAEVLELTVTGVLRFGFCVYIYYLFSLQN